jgi:protein TonB
MSVNKYAGATMDDIVFEGRNKDYGAYELRKINPKYAAISTGIAVAAYVIFILLSGSDIKFGKDKSKEEVEVSSTEVELPKDLPKDIEAPPPPPPPPPPPEAPQIKFVEMVVKKDEEVADKEIVTQKELQDDKKMISDQNKEGDANAKSKIVEPDPPKYGSGPVVPREPEDKPDDNAVFEIVEKQAEFPGGPTEMMKFIQKNLVYPEIAQENTIEGTVVVEFIVEKDGSIGNIKVIKDIGGGCGDAAVNVMKKMPKWNPGKQRDNPVRVKMKAPIKFRLSK